MKKQIMIVDKASKNSYEQTMKLIKKEITPSQYVKDNAYYTLVGNIYEHHFSGLSDASTIIEYVQAGADIYRDLSALNKFMHIEYGGNLDEYLLRLIAGQIIYYFDKSDALLYENEESLKMKFQVNMSETAGEPYPTDKSFHVYLNKLIYQKEIRNEKLVSESGLDWSMIAALRCGDKKYSKDIACILAITLQLTRLEAKEFIEKSGHTMNFEEKRDEVILAALDNLIQMKNMPDHKGKTGVDIINILLKRQGLKPLSNTISRKEKVNNKRTILITGAFGFLGRNCVDYFTKLVGGKDNQIRYKVCILSSKSVSNDSIPDNVTYYYGKINNSLIFERILLENHVDYIFHLAAIPIPQDAKRNQGETIDINTQTLNILCNTILQNKIPIKGIIFPSTENVYSGSQGTLKEDIMIEDDFIETTYAYSKLMAERIARRYAKDGIPIVILRLCNIYGEQDYHTDGKRLIPTTINLLLQEKPPVLYVDQETGLSEQKDFLYVGDLVRVFEQIILGFERSKEAFNRNDIIYNLGSGQGYYIETIQKIIMSIMNKEKAAETKEVVIKPRGIMDIDKIKRDFNFTPQVSLEEGLERTVRWYMENRDLFSDKE